MPAVNERYIVDESGKRVGVLLDLADYQRLREAWEELEDLRAFDAAKADSSDQIPFEQAVAEIEGARG